MMLDSAVINIDHAVVSYRNNIALRGVSLQVEPEEFIAIIGPNGAGKTTLLTVINGLGRLSGGNVCVLGHAITPGNGHALRKRVGYVAQVQQIDPKMPISVRESVMIGRYGRLGLFRHPGKADWEIVDDAIEQVGISHLARRPIGHLSGGERQRAAIARCLAQQPELFLLDEPTASLDWKARSGIIELVREIHERRRITTLFVTHDLGSLPVSCDRVVLMKEGLIWADGCPAELLTDENLSRLFGMPVGEVRRRKWEGAAAAGEY